MIITSALAVLANIKPYKQRPQWSAEGTAFSSLRFHQGKHWLITTFTGICLVCINILFVLLHSLHSAVLVFALYLLLQLCTLSPMCDNKSILILHVLLLINRLFSAAVPHERLLPFPPLFWWGIQSFSSKQHVSTVHFFGVIHADISSGQREITLILL